MTAVSRNQAGRFYSIQAVTKGNIEWNDNESAGATITDQWQV